MEQVKEIRRARVLSWHIATVQTVAETRAIQNGFVMFFFDISSQHIDKYKRTELHMKFSVLYFFKG